MGAPASPDVGTRLSCTPITLNIRHSEQGKRLSNYNTNLTNKSQRKRRWCWKTPVNTRQVLYTPTLTLNRDLTALLALTPRGCARTTEASGTGGSEARAESRKPITSLPTSGFPRNPMGSRHVHPVHKQGHPRVTSQIGHTRGRGTLCYSLKTPNVSKDSDTQPIFVF